MSNRLISNYTKKDFTSSQEVRWCPGCGDYAILSAIQNTLPEINKAKEDIVFISGIGCSSRLPYYLDTYGFHTIHGRALAISTGVKLANPKLSVWVITGDGDALAIGGNHFIHTLRRNVNLNILLFNNEIYGLTKGQFSPTSKKGIVTKSSPQGTVDTPFHIGKLALGAGTSFFARIVDTLPKKMSEVFIVAEKFKGSALVEILQNCIIFNDKTFQEVTDKDLTDDNTIWLEHGKPMVFGKDNNKGLIISNLEIKAIEIDNSKPQLEDILIHDAYKKDTMLHELLASMHPEKGLPIALGIIRQCETETFDDVTWKQIKNLKKETKTNSLKDILNQGTVWEI